MKINPIRYTYSSKAHRCTYSSKAQQINNLCDEIKALAPIKPDEKPTFINTYLSKERITEYTIASILDTILFTFATIVLKKFGLKIFD